MGFTNWQRSTSFRLALAVCAAMLVAFALLGSGVFYAVSAIISSGLHDVIRAENKGLVDIYKQRGLADLRAELVDRNEAPENPDAVYGLVDANHRIVLGEFATLPPNVMKAHGWIAFHERVNDGRVGVLAFIQPIGRDGFFLTGLQTHRRDRFLTLMLRTSLYALLATVVLGLLIGWLTTRLVAARLEAMHRAVQRVGEGELHARAPFNNSDDAFDRIAGAFNSMLDRIQELLDGVRHATDHIAHDLRTPLTRLRNRLESMRGQDLPIHEAADSTGDGAASPASRQAELDAALTDTDQLLSAFGALLRLARIEAQQPSSGEPEISLDAVLNDALELYAPIAAQRRIALHSEIAHVQLRGDADQLFQLAANLLDNALKYAPDASEVRILLTADTQAAILRIEDRGPGIPAADHERVFDRFVRLETHRGSPGTGLGLSLARAIVQRHGGRIALEDNAPGLCIRITLPLSSSA